MSPLITLREQQRCRVLILSTSGSSLAELSNPHLKLEKYDPVHKEWEKHPEPDFMTTEPHVGAIAIAEQFLYVIGGSDSSGKYWLTPIFRCTNSGGGRINSWGYLKRGYFDKK